jgi:hypothetical protein
MRECQSKQNLANCNCTWEPCSRKGICCECLTYHWSQHELPACFFPAAVERTYDRSLRKFVSLNKNKC